jgi:hypothetical protein
MKHSDVVIHDLRLWYHGDSIFVCYRCLFLQVMGEGRFLVMSSIPPVACFVNCVSIPWVYISMCVCMFFWNKCFVYEYMLNVCLCAFFCESYVFMCVCMCAWVLCVRPCMHV